MRNLVHFDIAESTGRVSITSLPAVGGETIFSENFLLNRAENEVPGIVTHNPLAVDVIITVTPFADPPKTFRIDSVGDYEDPVSGPRPITVYYTTRMT